MLTVANFFSNESTMSFAETKYYKHRKLEIPFSSVISEDGYHMIYEQESDSDTACLTLF